MSTIRMWRTCWRAVALALTLAATGAVAADATFKLAHMFARNSIPDKAATKFAELVASQSGGSVAVTVYPDGHLGDERENIALLRKGNLDFSITGDVVVSGLGEKYRVVNLPFLYRDARHALGTYDSELGDGIRQALAKEGLMVLSWHYVGTRLLTANKPVRHVADLKGLRLRLPQDVAWMTTWEALGAAPKVVSFTELAASLKLGKVDAQENPPNFIRMQKIYEHQKYLIMTNHMPQRQFIMASAALWQRLPAARRALLQAAARQASAAAVSMADNEQATDVRWLTHEGGMTPVEFDRGGLAAALARLPQVLGGSEGEAMARRIQALR